MTLTDSHLAADEAAIRAIVQQMMDGWNAHSGDRFAAPFVEDADYVVVTGQHVRGRAAIRAGHEALFETRYRNSHNEYIVEQVRFLREDVALAHVRAHLVYPWEGSQHEGHARFVLVLLKDAGKWQVEAFHNTPIQQP